MPKENLESVCQMMKFGEERESKRSVHKYDAGDGSG